MLAGSGSGLPLHSGVSRASQTNRGRAPISHQGYREIGARPLFVCGEPCSSESEAMVAAQQRHGFCAASLLTLELRRSTRSTEKDPIPDRRACSGPAPPGPCRTVPAAAVARNAADRSSPPRVSGSDLPQPWHFARLAASMAVTFRKPRQAATSGPLNGFRSSSALRVERRRSSAGARRLRLFRPDAGTIAEHPFEQGSP